MGADLYIESISDARKAEFKPKFHAACKKCDKYDKEAERLEMMKGKKSDEAVKMRAKADKAQKQVDEFYDKIYEEGYFRDPYNSWDLLWQLGLSWWADILPMKIKKTGHMPVNRMKKFREMVQTAEFKFCKETLKMFRDIAKKKKKTLAQVKKENRPYFDANRAELIKFLDTAIEMKEPIYCSL